ncbi:hypothetical protein [Christensenella tenuis]|uniref:Uncharacterized protein n=1 Tax=Christensenella tenuis TaxID=2763033 RepID=A0ABR7EAZ5_9FIRM|nr:hypothetical protein [Christensenella tenuis]MBC5646961.1 hypothetical protein [Christensenella tenuis]
MRKFFLLAVSVGLLLLLTGCQSAFSLSPAEVQSVDAFTGSVPAAAVQKTVSRAEDIKRLTEAVNQIKLLGSASQEDEVAGGIGLHLRFYLTDGASVTVSIGENGSLLRKSGRLYSITPIACDILWESLDYEEVPVPESELPVVS